MLVISVLGQKGGSGKTTISLNIARGLQLSGANVIVIDTDKQGSSRDWYSTNEGGLFPVIGMDRANTLDKDIKNLGNFDIAIIDGSPQLKDMAIACVKVSNIILIPIQPSQLDIWATSDLLELISERKLINEDLKIAFIVNRQISGSKAKKEIKEILAGTGYKFFENSTNQRMDYINTIANGKTVFESSGKAKEEMTQIVNELMEFINDW